MKEELYELLALLKRLPQLKEEGSITDFEIRVTHQNNEIILDTYITPKEPIKYITLNSVITNTGVYFSEWKR